MITASIVTYHHSTAEIRIVLECVIDSSVDKVYIIDNTNNDLLRELQELSPKIRYVHNENIGYGGAHNIAIRDAMALGSTYHVVVNPDIYFDRGTIEALANYMDANLDVGQVMPKVFYPNGDIQYLCKLIPTPFDLIFKRFIPSKYTVKSLDRFQLRFTGYNKVMNVPYLSGCFMFFRVSALQDIGLFDERFFMYPEDIDITRRMHEKHKTIFLPSVSIIHAHAAESKTNKKMLKIHIGNMIKYFNKWGWVFDDKRSSTNKKILNELSYKK